MADLTVWERFASRMMIEKSYCAVRAIATTLGLFVGLVVGFGLSRIVAG